MIVVDMYLARTDLFRRPDESCAEHTARMTKLMDQQWKEFDIRGEDGTIRNPEELGKDFQEVRFEYPEWLIQMFKDLHPRRFWHPILEFLRLKRKIQWEVYDVDNRTWKIFFRNKAEAEKAVGSRAAGLPDIDGIFQKRFNKAIASDPAKAKWAESHRVQIGVLTEINSDVLENDQDLLDHHRATA